MNSLINKTIQGIRWNFQSQITTSVINFLVSIILMRLLLPSDFGKFTMVYVVFSFIHIFRDVGLSQAIIQNKNLNSSHKASAFWFHIILGLLLLLIFINAGEWVNALYGETDLQNMTFWLAIDLFIGAIGLVPIALLQKSLNFKLLFRIQIYALTISAIVGIVMAYLGYEYYSLIAKIICWTAINSIGAFIYASWKPKWRFSLNSLKELINFGIPVTGNQLLSFLVRKSDDFFIGNVIGATPLGWYNRAYALMLLPIGNITSVLQNVLLSTWSKMQDDKPSIKAMYIQVTGMIALISFPLMTFLCLFAYPIIIFVFGRQWAPMTLTLQILSIIGMIQSVSALVGMLFMVFDKNKLLFKINLASSIFTISFIIWSVYAYKSIEVTAFVYGLTSLILIYPVYYFAGRIIESNVLELLRPVFAPLAFSILMAASGWFLFHYLPIESIIMKLFISGSVALMIYVILCYNTNIQPYQDLKKVYSRFKNPGHDKT